MTVSGKWFVLGSALSVGAGFLGGMMFGRRTAPANMVAFGRTFRVSSDIFVDSAALEYLKARADSAAAANDAASRHILQDLEKFGLLLDGGRWNGWHTLELMTISAQQDKEKR